MNSSMTSVITTLEEVPEITNFTYIAEQVLTMVYSVSDKVTSELFVRSAEAFQTKECFESLSFCRSRYNFL